MNVKDFLLRPSAKMFIVGIFAFVGMFAKLGNADLQPLGSAAHASISREINRTGDWLTLHWPHSEAYADFYQHPPLFFWLQAATFKVFGTTDAAAKYVSSFFGFAAIILTYLLGRILFSENAGFVSSMLMSLTPYFFKHSRKCELESTLVFFMAAAFLFFILAQKKDSRFYALAGIATGLSFLSKGPPAGAVYGAIFIYLAVTKKWDVFVNKWFLSGIVLSVAIPAAWIIPQFIYKGDTFWRKYVLEQIWWSLSGRPAEMLASPMAATRRLYGWQKFASYFYFFGAFFTYYMPWSVVGIFGAARALKEKRNEGLILILWSAVVWVGFTMAGFKDDYYLLPMWPSCCVLAGYFLDGKLSEIAKRRTVFGAAALAALLVGAAYLTPLEFDKKRNPEFLSLGPVIARTVPENQRVLTYGLFYLDMTALLPWYADRGATELKSLEELRRELSEGKKKFILMKKNEFDILPSGIKGRIRPIYKQGAYVFLASNTNRWHLNPW
ncbi:MAG: glycosyltransferase family 39 protein [Endomicrobiia bacterium]|nr:glycosyltransferase family 39 protein [Endomicrobiia bacterium]